MGAFENILDEAKKLSQKLASLVKETEEKKAQLEASQTKVYLASEALKVREEKVKPLESAKDTLENAKAVLEQAKEIRILNNRKELELAKRQQEAEAKEKAANEAVAKLEREKHDLEAAKRNQAIYVQKFNADKAAWEAKVQKLGLRLE